MFTSSEPVALVLAKILLSMIEKRIDNREPDSKMTNWLKEQYEKCQKCLIGD